MLTSVKILFLLEEREKQINRHKVKENAGANYHISIFQFGTINLCVCVCLTIDHLGTLFCKICFPSICLVAIICQIISSWNYYMDRRRNLPATIAWKIMFLNEVKRAPKYSKLFCLFYFDGHHQQLYVIKSSMIGELCVYPN